MADTEQAGRRGRVMNARVLAMLSGLLLTVFICLPPPEPETPAIESAGGRIGYNEELARAEVSLEAARQRALKEVDRMFLRYSARTAGFAEEMCSWTTRGGLAKRWTKEGWQWLTSDEEEERADLIGEYVSEKFRNLVVSEEELSRDLEDALAQFRYDVTAAENEFLITVGMAPVDENGAEGFSKVLAGERLHEGTRAATASAPGDTMRYGTASLAAGAVVDTGVFAVVQPLATALASKIIVLAGSAAGSSAGATVAGAGSGGAGGTLAGPIGTVVGFAAGMAVGAVIDWKLTEKLAAEVEAQCVSMLDGLKREIIEGTNDTPGLRNAIDGEIDRTKSRLTEMVSGPRRSTLAVELTGKEIER